MRESAPLDRFNAFSDGVLAIVITILVLELPIPDKGQPILATLLEDWAAFLGYFISFSIVGGIWMQQSSLTKLMSRADVPSYGLNLLVLLWTGLLPFSTKLLVTHLGDPGAEVAVLVYGINALLASATLSWLMMYVAKRPELLLNDVADTQLKLIYRRRWVSIAVNVGALLIAFIAPLIAILLYLIQSLILLATPILQAFFAKKTVASNERSVS